MNKTDLAKVLQKLTTQIQQLLGDKLNKIVLFGSYAHGDNTVILLSVKFLIYIMMLVFSTILWYFIIKSSIASTGFGRILRADFISMTFRGY